MRQDRLYDLVVVGGGIGGLAVAALAQRLNLRVALLEAHTKLGGCAGYFRRGPYTFDAGATALMGLEKREPIGALLDFLGVDFHAMATPSYRVHLPDRSLDIVSETSAFERAAAEAFPGRDGAKRLFWRLQEAVGVTLFRAAGRVPRLPLRSLGDLAYDFRILGISGLLAGALAMITVQDVLSVLGLGRDRAFRALIAILLEDTAQAGPEIVPFANAAACLQAYRSGMSRPKGGMRALVEGIGQRFAECGGDLRTATRVDRVIKNGPDEFAVLTRRGERLRTRQVAFNTPVDRAAALLGRELTGRLGRRERASRASWGAFMGYLAIPRSVVPDDTPLFHQVLQDYDGPTHDGNNVLVSLSPMADIGYGPSEVRVATLSTHTRVDGWSGIDPEPYQARKLEFRGRLLSALDRALPGASSHLLHQEFASPRSFERYTRRVQGRVGGPPVSRLNSNFLAVGPDVLGPRLWLVGDSVFPGQGTLATFLSAIRVVERITGIHWDQVIQGLSINDDARGPRNDDRTHWARVSEMGGR